MRYKVFREQDSLYIYATDGQTAQYTSYKNGRYSIAQKEGNNYRLVYGQPHIVMQYPLIFKNSFSSQAKALETCPQHLTVPVQTRSESQVVGYGNLVLPNHKLIQEAFLIRTIYTSLQTKDSSGFYEEAYRFYSSEMLFPIIEQIKTYRYSDKALLSEFMYYYEDEEMAMQSFSVDENTLNKTEQNLEKQTVSAVYPNPTSNRLEVKMHIEHETVVKLHIKNLSGQVLKTMAWTFKTPGDYRQTLYLNEYGLPVGTYLIQLDMNQTAETHKIEYIR
jgi:hypothetical protein